MTSQRHHKVQELISGALIHSAGHLRSREAALPSNEWCQWPILTARYCPPLMNKAGDQFRLAADMHACISQMLNLSDTNGEM